MTQARERLVCLETTPYYHCMARCVRRAFLCGEDAHSGQSFDHRKGWLVDRMKQLTEIFSIKICAYAVMSNHYHLVLKVDKSEAESWSIDEVIERWCELYKGTLLVERYRQSPETLSPAELETVLETVEAWRLRLYDLGWFMRCLNEYIARKANKEDKCKGRFWEGRFKSQALLDEVALLSCMMYVDLNPIRAGLTEKLEASDFTSIYDRLVAIKKTHNTRTTAGALKQLRAKTSDRTIPVPKGLLAFSSQVFSKSESFSLPFDLRDYLELIEWTGRAQRDDKRGAIPEQSVLVFERLNINPDYWLEHVQLFGQRYASAAGSEVALADYRSNLDLPHQTSQGVRASRCLYR